MDIQILLWLQSLRQSLPGFVETLFVWFSDLAMNPLIVIIPCIIYWCFDKRKGETVVFSFALGSPCMALLKCTACVYRPWVQSAEIHPAEAALRKATGYSFPSGHTQTAASVFGSIGWLYRERSKALAIFCCAFVALIGFSRNFLGVHTPQDVLVGLLVGIGSVAAALRLQGWLEGGEGRDRALLVVSTIAFFGFVAYIMLKGYPMDTVNGALLADPAEMKIDALSSVGMFYGVMLGWFLERRFVGFATDGGVSTKRRLIRVTLGVVFVLAFRMVLPLPLSVVLAEPWLSLAKNFLTAFAITFVAPFAFTAAERRAAA